MNNLDQLRTFLEAYRLGSITKAAERLHMTQPAASAHIKALETLIEKKLFVRHARGVKATAIADDLARSIAPHLEQIEVKFNAARARIANISGTIHLATPAEILSAKLLPAIVSLLGHDLKIRIHLGGKERIYQLLNDGAIDLAVTASQPQNQALGFHPIQQETLILVAAPDWAKHNLIKPFSPQELLTKPLIAYDEDLPLIRDYFDTVFQIQINHQAAITVPDLRIVRSLVSLGEGYTVLPQYLCQEQLQNGTLSLLSNPEQPPVNNLYLVWNKGNLRHPRVTFVRDRLLAELQNFL
ncbi:LysR family transcriptional regulator [Pleurocapsa sp. PCC 7319]|uniref:LysR family transcriptional regulator n=1 Tax=Pleurocapsa sp. PCC 7319 TaxID=118161 RepID=UPI0003477E40|nr:LysR family transcriptional regulator [Pleurocapsa sp. PCC 7319]